MKKKLLLCFFVFCILCTSLLSGCGKPAIQKAEEDTLPQTEAVLEETAAEQTEETQPPLKEGFLYLTVSSIDFSLVGESEDIYVGSIPREDVTWVSEDESVVTFENGVLTATGVGSTKVSASYGDQTLECAVGCLAQTGEELLALDNAILRSPKRYPPVMGDEPMSYFDDVAIVGDSISQIMSRWELRYNYLGNVDFMVKGGSSLNGYVREYVFLFYQGQDRDLDEAVALSSAKKLFIMMGQNDLSYMTLEETMANWEILLNRILEKRPDIEIYLQSCVPEWPDHYGDNRKNILIDEHNVALKAFAEENGYHFVDIEPYVEDHTNKMASDYNMDDSIHMNEAGCYTWMQALKSYAYLQELNLKYAEE